LAIATLTREQVRTSVGYNLGAIRLIEADAASSTSSFRTDELSLGGAGEQSGGWLIFTSGDNDGSIRRVYDSSISNQLTTLDFHPRVGTAVADGDTAELWNEDYNPEFIHNFINQSILFSYGHVYDPVEDISLHGDGKTARFDIPSGFSMLNRVEYRSRITALRVLAMSAKFDETEDSDFDQDLYTEDKKQGAQSLKLTIGSGVSAGDFITDSLTSIDISKYTHLEGWVKATTTLAANDFVIRLDSGTVQGDSTDLEVLNVPATTGADTWTFFRIALGNPEKDTAIVSVGLEYNANHGANTVWFDDLRVVVNDTAIWAKLLPRHWRIDKEARDLILTLDGRRIINYNLIKLSGGDEPVLLNADATANEIDDQYVIAMTTALALNSRSNSMPADELDGQRRQTTLWFSIAERAKRRFPILTGVREIE
jgi:hypothetical protein